MNMFMTISYYSSLLFINYFVIIHPNINILKKEVFHTFKMGSYQISVMYDEHEY